MRKYVHTYLCHDEAFELVHERRVHMFRVPAWLRCAVLRQLQLSSFSNEGRVASIRMWSADVNVVKWSPRYDVCGK